MVRGRRPLGVAPAEGWLAGRDRTDLFLYGDTLLLAAKLWAMLGLFVTLDRRPSRRLFAAVVGVGLPLVFYSLALWDSLPSAVLETGMALKDVIILVGGRASISAADPSLARCHVDWESTRSSLCPVLSTRY